MPEPTGREHYKYRLTDEEKQEVLEFSAPGNWSKRRNAPITDSGFVMFHNRPNPTYREAGIGPTSDGEVRAYVETETDDGYKTEERFEGTFDEAFLHLQRWLVGYQ